jgi:hypothetical protein
MLKHLRHTIGVLLALAFAMSLPARGGGLNGSTQHSGRTQFALKTKAKSLGEVRTARALPWLGFERV